MEFMRVQGEGSFTNIRMNALESWSFDPDTAAGFGDLVLQVDVPASRVISTARTGLGCLHEYEFVLIGSNSSEYAAIATIL